MQNNLQLDKIPYMLVVMGYCIGCGYLSMCNGELWQHTDRQRYKTYIIRQRSTYLLHTARTVSLPCASRATDAVEIRYISVNILAKYLIVQTPRRKDLVVFCLSLGYSRSQRSHFCYRSLTFPKNDTNVSKKLTPRATMQL